MKQPKVPNDLGLFGVAFLIVVLTLTFWSFCSWKQYVFLAGIVIAETILCFRFGAIQRALKKRRTNLRLTTKSAH